MTLRAGSARFALCASAKHGENLCGGLLNGDVTCRSFAPLFPILISRSLEALSSCWAHLCSAPVRCSGSERLLIWPSPPRCAVQAKGIACHAVSPSYPLRAQERPSSWEDACCFSGLKCTRCPAGLGDRRLHRIEQAVRQKRLFNNSRSSLGGAIAKRARGLVVKRIAGAAIRRALNRDRSVRPSMPGKL